MQHEAGTGMWTGNQMTRWLSMVAVLLCAAACGTGARLPDDQDGSAAAWWYDMDFEPVSTSIHGTAVKSIDASWKAATVLDIGLLAGRVSQDQLTRFANSGLSFSLRADHDSDGVPESFFVGTFKTETGSTGRFVAVMEDGKLVQHFQHAGAAGFSALLGSADGIRWYKCMECGEFETMIWTGDSYVLE